MTEARAPGEEIVSTIHCHFCGGFIHNPATIEFRPPRASAQFALPHEGRCTCTPPIVYEDPPLFDSPPDDEEGIA
ncbi:MAG TPA: hypothetical protein VN908_05615 [Gemmatimonadales bacterium]|nr:hypothetical protein [Gemmatimonadales bacterium]